MNELALFAGAGGGILGGVLLGWKIRCAVEIDPYARSVLLARQNDGSLPPFPVWDDVRTFDGKPWHGIIDVVSGGFPCQDISCAGRGIGITGNRSGLWKEMARIIGEVKPKFVFIENSPMLRTRGLDVVLEDIAALGYSARWGIVSAENTGAPHRRKRIWIVGYTNYHGLASAEIGGSLAPGSDGGTTRTQQTCELTRSSQQCASMADPLRGGERVQQIPREKCKNTPLPYDDGASQSMADPDSKRQPQSSGLKPDVRRRPGNSGKTVPDTDGTRCKDRGKEETGEPYTGPQRYGGAGWPPEPDICRVVNGMASRVDRVKCLGNGQVPRVAAAAWAILNDYHKN